MADLRTSVPPQLAQATSTTSIMLDVIVALIPALGMSVYLFGPRVLALTLISVGACVLSEYLYRPVCLLSDPGQPPAPCCSAGSDLRFLDCL